MNSLISPINDRSKLVICSALAKEGKSFTSSQVKIYFQNTHDVFINGDQGDTQIEMDDSQVWFLVSALWNCIGDEGWCNCKSMVNW